MLDREGFQIIRTIHGQEIPSETFYERYGVYAYKAYIPSTYTSATIVYFVSGTNGDEYGQFPTKVKALSKARQMAKLSVAQRKRYDQ